MRFYFDSRISIQYNAALSTKVEIKGSSCENIFIILLRIPLEKNDGTENIVSLSK